MSKNFKFILAGLVLAMLAGMILLTTESRHDSHEATYPPEDLMRLHVVANSDSTADQNLKRKVRDEIVRSVASEFLRAENINSARLTALDNLDSIREIALREIKAEGKDYTVGVELNSFTFPTKHYGPFILPAGDYEAIRVVIGTGGGANWWCVLFPPLCFVDMSKAVAVPEPEDEAPASTPPMQSITGLDKQPPVLSEETSETTSGKTYTRVEFRFKILDLFKKLTG